MRPLPDQQQRHKVEPRKHRPVRVCHMHLPPPASLPRGQGLARLAQAGALKRAGREACGVRLRANGEGAADHVAAAAERDGHAVRAGLGPAQGQAPCAAARRQRCRHAAARAGGACAARPRGSRPRRVLGRRLDAMWPAWWAPAVRRPPPPSAGARARRGGLCQPAACGSSRPTDLGWGRFWVGPGHAAACAGPACMAQLGAPCETHSRMHVVSANTLWHLQVHPQLCEDQTTVRAMYP